MLVTEWLEFIIEMIETKKVGNETEVDKKLIGQKAQKIYHVVHRIAFCVSLVIQIGVVGHYFNQVFNHNEALPLNTVNCDESSEYYIPDLCF